MEEKLGSLSSCSPSLLPAAFLYNEVSTFSEGGISTVNGQRRKNPSQRTLFTFELLSLQEIMIYLTNPMHHSSFPTNVDFV